MDQKGEEPSTVELFSEIFESATEGAKIEYDIGQKITCVSDSSFKVEKIRALHEAYR